MWSIKCRVHTKYSWCCDKRCLITHSVHRASFLHWKPFQMSSLTFTNVSVMSDRKIDDVLCIIFSSIGKFLYLIFYFLFIFGRLNKQWEFENTESNFWSHVYVMWGIRRWNCIFAFTHLKHYGNYFFYNIQDQFVSQNVSISITHSPEPSRFLFCKFSKLHHENNKIEYS